MSSKPGDAPCVAPAMVVGVAGDEGPAGVVGDVAEAAGAAESSDSDADEAGDTMYWMVKSFASLRAMSSCAASPDQSH